MISLWVNGTYIYSTHDRCVNSQRHVQVVAIFCGDVKRRRCDVIITSSWRRVDWSTEWRNWHVELVWWTNQPQWAHQLHWLQSASFIPGWFYSVNLILSFFFPLFSSQSSKRISLPSSLSSSIYSYFFHSKLIPVTYLFQKSTIAPIVPKVLTRFHLWSPNRLLAPNKFISQFIWLIFDFICS